MTRIVELLIAINAIAGIAVFLGLRSVIRRRLFRRKPKAVPPAVTPIEARTGHCRGGNHEDCNGGFETPNGVWVTCNCPCHTTPRLGT